MKIHVICQIFYPLRILALSMYLGIFLKAKSYTKAYLQRRFWYLLERRVSSQFAVNSGRWYAQHMVNDVYDTVCSGQVCPNHSSVYAASLQGQCAVFATGDHVEEQILPQYLSGNLKALIH